MGGDDLRAAAFARRHVARPGAASQAPRWRPSFARAYYALSDGSGAAARMGVRKIAHRTGSAGHSQIRGGFFRNRSGKSTPAVCHELRCPPHKEMIMRIGKITIAG